MICKHFSAKPHLGALNAGGKNFNDFDFITKSFQEEAVLKKILLCESNEEKDLYFTR